MVVLTENVMEQRGGRIFEAAVSDRHSAQRSVQTIVFELVPEKYSFRRMEILTIAN